MSGAVHIPTDWLKAVKGNGACDLKKLKNETAG